LDTNLLWFEYLWLTYSQVFWKFFSNWIIQLNCLTKSSILLSPIW
jgi:hypothetical protein